MTDVYFSKKFLSNFKKLPKTIQVRTDSLVGLLSIDFRDSRLHSKKLKGDNYFYSFRVGRDYRIIFTFQDDQSVILADIKHRKDIYKNIK